METFLQKRIAREGILDAILTDNGIQFVSREMEQFLVQHGIKHKRCALYHPETNGMVERFNRVLKQLKWLNPLG